MSFVRRGACRVFTLVCLVAGGGPVAAQSKAPAGPIKDNSFLIEEAYNQEAGVVQHINTFTRPTSGGGWVFSFTQEWPVSSMRHQLSYTVPVFNDGLGDVAINYRYQLLGMDGGKVAVAPRLSVLAPSGDATGGLGSGALGIQGNLPTSVEVNSRLTVHSNGGFTWTPNAQDALGNTATTTSYSAGGSLIWLATETFNVMFESVWTSSEVVTGAGLTGRSDSFVIAPGVRKAFNFANGMQIVPGAAFVKGIGDNSSQQDLFFYLSIEHPFKRR